jgi:hypothetical protein
LEIELARTEIVAILDTFQEDAAKKIESIINKLDIDERINALSSFSYQQFSKLYLLSKDLKIDNWIIEHIYYQYYNLAPVTDEMITQLLNDFSKSGFIALKSAAINLLKEDLVTECQIERIMNEITDKEVTKQVFLNNVRKKLKSSQLNESEITQLIEYEAFNLLLEIVEKDMLSKDILQLFVEPADGEKHKKKKQLIFQIAQKKLRQQ